MSRDSMRGPGDPTPLAVVGATDLERRLLSAAAAERPSDDMTRQMRLALGFTAVAAPVAAVGAVAATKVVAAKSITGWVAAWTLAAAVTGGGIAMWHLAGAPTPPPTPPRVAPAAVVTPVVSAPEAPARATAAPHASHRRRASAPALASNDLRDEIALVDAARSSLEAGAPERALVLLRRYAASYPAGTFRPEAAVLRIESLAATGRRDEARALARDFVARHPASPLSERMARLAASP